jgi:hypothetical protein
VHLGAYTQRPGESRTGGGPEAPDVGHRGAQAQVRYATERGARAMAAAGIQPLGIHDCRHTYASLMIAAGVARRGRWPARCLPGALGKRGGFRVDCTANCTAPRAKGGLAQFAQKSDL